MDLQIIQSKIYEIRGYRVMLDSDLAALYQVETKALKQAVKRNLDRFPDDFMFELTKEETECLRSQIATLEKGADDETNLRSQIVTSSFLYFPSIYFFKQKRVVDNIVSTTPRCRPKTSTAILKYIIIYIQFLKFLTKSYLVVQ